MNNNENDLLLWRSELTAIYHASSPTERDLLDGLGQLTALVKKGVNTSRESFLPNDRAELEFQLANAKQVLADAQAEIRSGGAYQSLSPTARAEFEQRIAIAYAPS